VVRVVAGSLRGRRLVAPRRGPGPEVTRPTTDKVRESVFNALGSRHLLDDVVVMDLFAGSGALGIEALSRGARHCTFVERDARAVAALRTNLAHLGLSAQAEVVVADVVTARHRLPDVDVVFADPPYEFDQWESLLEAIDARLVVAESDRVLGATPGWDVVQSRRYGRTWVTWLEQVP
jgi:16S rRNA (guanine966-N2)-methyltransferase